MTGIAPDTAEPGAAPLLRSTRLLVGLRVRRLVNQFDSLAAKKKSGDKTRTGTAGKKSSKAILFLIWPLMFFAFGAIGYASMSNLHVALDPPDTFWLTTEFSGPLTIGVTFMLTFFWLSALLTIVASGELAKSDWDLEWLVTLPMRSDTLIWARILERSLVQPVGVGMLVTSCTVLAWLSGFRWLAPLVGALAAWPLMLLGAIARTLIDTGLRLRMKPAQLRNLHAVLAVASIVVMYLGFSLGLPNRSGFMVGLASAMPEWLRFTPMGLTVAAINERGAADALWPLLGLIAEVAVLTWLGVKWLSFLLRHGVISGSSRDAARGAGTVSAPVPMTATSRGGWLRVSAVQLRELQLLSRDRNFMVQSLVLPLLIVGGQLVLGQSGAASDMWKNPNVLASVAFGLAAYSLSMSAFQTLNTEGHALWLLYTFPKSIEEVLRDKAKLWGVLTLAYPVVLFGIGSVLMPVLDWKFAAAVATTLLGIPIYAFIAVALGVFGSNPLEQQQNLKVKPEFIYLYLLLAGLYMYAVVTPELSQRLIFIVLTMLLAFALWQKARDQLPYLLDPDASPPPRVSTADGLIATMVFFVIQGVAAVIAGRSQMKGGTVLVAFTIGGALTYTLMRWVYARAKTEHVPRILKPGGNRPLLGVAAGLAAGVVALTYLFAIRGTGLLEDAIEQQSLLDLGWWLLPLALIAAPLFEEFIFRGLIFGGLRRSFGLWPAALASAALFAIIHPPVSVVPVFCLGLATAWVYDRSRSLLAPMLAHATYNACVVGSQFLLL